MNDLEYKKQILDPKSASFCGAKWYNATIWLGSGMTTSCHHPLPHKIDLEEIKKNPSAIHNTVQKIIASAKTHRNALEASERYRFDAFWRACDIAVLTAPAYREAMHTVSNDAQVRQAILGLTEFEADITECLGNRGTE